MAKVLDNLKFALVHHGIKGEENELLVYNDGSKIWTMEIQRSENGKNYSLDTKCDLN